MKYSIILPVRNGGFYIKECINSILGQTVRDFNIVVLDNCSTDGTPEWLHSLGDSRIIVHPSSMPLSIEENWRRVAGVPKNEFMTCIGHDDLLDSNYLETMDRLIGQHPQASLYQAHFRYIDGAGKLNRRCLPMNEAQQAHEFLAQQMLRFIDSTGTGYMMRSNDYDLLGGIPFYPNLIFADYELWMRLSLKSYKATALAECFSYRLHASVSAQTNGQLYQQAFFQYLGFIKNMTGSHEKVEEVVSRYGRQFLYYYCESLSHRLLKTERSDREISVAEFIGKCKEAAAQLIPGQEFDPYKVFRIKIAARLDSNAAGRAGFKLIRKML